MTKLLFKTAKRSHKPLHLLMATLTVALVAGFAQTANAAPGGGPGGPPDGAPYGMMDGMGGMQHMGAHGHAGRMLDTVNATPEQRAQIKQILDTARTESRAQHDAGRKLHEQGQALFAQPNVDARAVEALRQQQMALHEQASKRMTQVMIDISRVLTPEQRKMLADSRAQRQDMMERHRAERATLEKAKP